MKKIIDLFNHQSACLVISDYPEKTKKGERNYGIAWYTKELITPMAKNCKKRFVVLAEKGLGQDIELYQKERILVIRAFDQKQPSLFPRILRWLAVFNRIEDVHVHSEFCINGGVKNFILLIPFLLMIKLAGKKITYFSHNVVTEVEPIAPHLGMKNKSATVKIFKLALVQYYMILGIIVDRFVVMDKSIEKRLANLVDPRKVILNPFWIKSKTFPLSPGKSKTKLGFAQKDFVLLYFGFITYYKGADWLVEAVRTLTKQKEFQNIHLVLAGGKAYSHRSKGYYQKYYYDLKRSLRNAKNIVLTGFVPEDKIGLYFKASDLVILPYRGLIGGSGSLIQALSYGKPFIISNKMKELLENVEYKKVFEKYGLKPEDIIFKHNYLSFKKLLTRVKSQQFLKELTKLSKTLAYERSVDKLIANCYNSLFISSNYANRMAPKISIAYGKSI
jgi:glycosyltransferase involved in cell wall biosynthesis